MDKDEFKNEVFDKLHHISIVVRDAEKAQKYYESIGIGPWVEYPPMKEYVKINVPDENGFYNLKIKCVQIGPIQLQLVEPGDGIAFTRSIWKKRARASSISASRSMTSVLPIPGSRPWI